MYSFPASICLLLVCVYDILTHKWSIEHNRWYGSGCPHGLMLDMLFGFWSSKLPRRVFILWKFKPRKISTQDDQCLAGHGIFLIINFVLDASKVFSVWIFD